MKLSNSEIKSFLTLIEINTIEKPTLKYLNLIIAKVTDNIPWQNITMVNNGLGKVPSCSDIKLKMLNGIGGICLDINIFMLHLLEKLGYDVQYILCGRDREQEKKHLALVVYIDANPFFVDCGDAQPYYEAINLNENIPLIRKNYQFKIEKQSNNEYKLFRNKEKSNWEVLYVFDLQKYTE